LPEIAITEGRDFSILGLIQHADPFVQAIMLLLAMCSVGCWALILEKTVRLAMLRAQVRALAQQAAAGRLTFDGVGLVGAVAAAAQSEWAKGGSRGESRVELRARLERAMRGAMKSAFPTITDIVDCGRDLRHVR
jgi:biopolymer transport protein TolQ